MVKYLFIVLFSISCLAGNAQVSDSLFAVHKGNGWVIRYTVKRGENAHMIATRFYISEGVLEYANEASAYRAFTPGSTIMIPVTRENYSVSKGAINNMQDLYYHVAGKDDISLLSTYAGVTKAEMRLWNNLHGNTIVPDQVLFIGWVKMVIKDSSNPISELAYPVTEKKATVKADTIKRVLGGLDTVYNRQTNSGANVITEKGTAVFFEKAGKNNVYFAFHNASVRGAIIKVFNPATGKTIYAKVLGPIPDTKLYANSIIGICSAAKEALGVNDSKAWCELSYSPN